MFSFRFDKVGFFSALTLMTLLGGTVLASILLFAIGGWNDTTILVWKWVVGTVWVLLIVTVLVRVGIYRYQMLRGVNPSKRPPEDPAGAPVKINGPPSSGGSAVSLPEPEES